jgi:hypothetical protein
MKKAKYIEAVEKTKKYPNRYVGIELQRTPEEVSLLCVNLRGDVDDIDIEDLDVDDYSFKPIDKETVRHYFTIVVKSQKTEVTDAEIKLMRARRNLKFCEDKIKENFGELTAIADVTT